MAVHDTGPVGRQVMDVAPHGRNERSKQVRDNQPVERFGLEILVDDVIVEGRPGSAVGHHFDQVPGFRQVV